MFAVILKRPSLFLTLQKYIYFTIIILPAPKRSRSRWSFNWELDCVQRIEPKTLNLYDFLTVPLRFCTRKLLYASKQLGNDRLHLKGGDSRTVRTLLLTVWESSGSKASTDHHSECIEKIVYKCPRDAAWQSIMNVSIHWKRWWIPYLLHATETHPRHHHRP